ncbi:MULTISPECIES: response regulator transcription factor [Clavibacter]|nr:MULTISPECIES: response regulator transcription factor [Clavibacter]KDP91505.1 hypothetical protein W824_06090 [Clavibacter cf. michiganensis LMG 26808]
MKQFLKHALAPAVAVVAGSLWWLSEGRAVLMDTVPTRDDTMTTSPYAALVLLGFVIAIAIAKMRPTWALALVGALLVTQLLFWPARFGQLSWVGYFVLVPLPVLLSQRIGSEKRCRFLTTVLGAAVSIAALLTLPSLSMSGEWGTLTGAPWANPMPVLQSIGISLVISIGLALAGWKLGRPPAEVPTVPQAAITTGVGADPAADEYRSLTQREREIFLLIARGRSNAEIADELFISEATVKTHVGNVLTKFGLASRNSLIVYAYDHGIVTPAHTGTRAQLS